MTKTKRYQHFLEAPRCFSYHYQEPPLNLGLDTSKPIIIEVGCGSWAYTKTLAEHDPNGQYIGVDSKSDRMSFGVEYCIKHHIDNTRRLRSQVDHLLQCIPLASVDHLRITFPDPRPTRDRQKLTSPKYQSIYRSLLRPWWTLHLKTDDELFFDYSLQALWSWWRKIITTEKDIYKDWSPIPWNQFDPIRWVQTYYEQQRLKKWRKIHYLSASREDGDSQENSSLL